MCGRSGLSLLTYHTIDDGVYIVSLDVSGAAPRNEAMALKGNQASSEWCAPVQSGSWNFGHQVAKLLPCLLPPPTYLCSSSGRLPASY
jgi:hypothetical protein